MESLGFILIEVLDSIRSNFTDVGWQDLPVILASFLMIDTPRYVISKLVLMLVDLSRSVAHAIYPETPQELAEIAVRESMFSPFVSVICPGRNEEKTMPKTIASILAQTYENFEIIVIDDGSTDGTWSAVSIYQHHPKVRLYRRDIAGGKASAANMGLGLADRAEIIVIVDSDSFYEPNALQEIIKPFIDSRVGGVSGNLRAANWDENFITRFQAADYLHSISLGRRLTSAVGTLAICSGAFGAFRKEAVLAVGGWDVGPGEDGDLTMKIRKLHYRVVFAPDAICQTMTPNTWLGWWKQRRRWNRGVVRYKMRKHVDMAIPGTSSFSFTNMLVVLDVLFFRLFVLYSFFIYFILMALTDVHHFIFSCLVAIVAYNLGSLVQLIVQLYYSDRPTEDLQIAIYSFMMYPYRIADKCCRLVSATEEFLGRRSYYDRYVPRRVGEATIHW